MILSRYIHSAIFQAFHRLIAAAMTILHLPGLSAFSQNNQLMAKANTKNRHLANNILDLRNSLFIVCRISRAFGYDYSIVIGFQNTVCPEFTQTHVH